jgi:four helix bundle protein
MQSQNQNSKNKLKQRCFNFSFQIIQFLKSCPTNQIVAQTLSRQLLRSATSIGANIIEVFGSDSKRDFQRYFTIALKSANETNY